MEKKEKKCPKCGATTKQRKMGFTRSGTQRYICGHCKKTYTPEAKRREYPEEIRKQAIKMYYSGVSANQVGKMFHMNKGNGKSERSSAKDQFPRDHHRKFRGLFGRFHLFKDVQKSVRHLPDRRTEKYPERIIFFTDRQNVYGRSHAKTEKIGRQSPKLPAQYSLQKTTDPSFYKFINRIHIPYGFSLFPDANLFIFFVQKRKKILICRHQIKPSVIR